jgi:hypothetical protein
MGSGITRGTAHIFEPTWGHRLQVVMGMGAGVDFPTHKLQIKLMYGQNSQVLAELWSK